MNQKGVGVILILILVAAAVLGGYFIYQKQTTSVPQLIIQSKSTPSSNITDETVNWELYKNIKYHYSFSYPKDKNWNISNSRDENNEPLDDTQSNTAAGLYLFAPNLNQPPNINYITSSVYLSVTVTSKTDPISVPIGLQIKESRQTKINNLNSMEYISEGNVMDTNYKFSNIYIDREDYYLVIEHQLNHDIDKDNQIFNQILSTFKFTN